MTDHTIESVFILAQQYGVAAWLGVRHTETRDALLAALTEVFAQAAPTKEQTKQVAPFLSDAPIELIEQWAKMPTKIQAPLESVIHSRKREKL